MQSLDIDSLRTFLACAAAPSFTEAGVRVNKSQSTVSMQMRRLEEVVGQPLFAKQGRRNRMTSAGQELLDYAERIVRLNDEAIGRLDTRAFSGRIRVGTPDDYAEAFLPEAFGRFARIHPQVEVEIECRQSRELAEMIVAGELDVAIVTVDETMPGVEVVHREALRWSAPPDHGVEHVRPLPLAVWQPGCVWRTRALEELAAAGVPYRIAYTGLNAAALTATVRAGLAVAPLPTSFLGKGLREVGADAGLPEPGFIEVALLRARSEPKELVDAFAGELAAAFRSLKVRPDLGVAA
ncbi:LysR substrate-binding domain-containing protein [Acuticoccus mangrovi]|uniref:LysR family transcriptional regulator n=1 Tax=Acuticoccus mangrovi TaxID=2796142 RepID=A0A934IP21_9HYPH|nr:LysR substrate-binding domain-containing protein [Acuticoccus mangrovi]MBJ3776120.1 LysR family transcriptional regulator [Acuticoccus mangrovi]